MNNVTTLTLNIGLNTNTGETLTSNNVLQHLTDTGFFVHASRTKQSSTEQTLIVRIDSVPTLVIYEASTALNQDCIAVSPDNGQTGELIGPNAAAWGEFNREYFLPL